MTLLHTTSKCQPKQIKTDKKNIQYDKKSVLIPSFWYGITID
ncbi:MAG: hypothetical protein ACI94Y_002742 [Maribacter sp.]|jgi:hypothetical protein